MQPNVFAPLELSHTPLISSNELQPSYGTLPSTKRILKSPPSLNIGKVNYLAFGFLVMFTAWFAIQNILTLVLKNEGYSDLGLVAFLVVFSSLGLGSITAPKYAAVLPYNLTFGLSSLGTAFFAGACLLISSCAQKTGSTEICSPPFLYTALIISSIITGLSMAILWVTQTVYITECSNDDNKGQLFGNFWSIMPASQVTGNLLSSTFYAAWGAEDLFLVCLILLLISPVVFYWVADPDAVEYEVIDSEGNSLIVKAQEDDTDRIEYTWDKTFRIMAREKFQPFIPFLLVVGCLRITYIAYLAILTIESLSNVSSATVQGEELGYVLFSLGVAEVAGGIMFGNLLDLNKKASVIVLYLVILLSSLSMTIAFETNTYWLYLVVAIAFGLSDSGSQAILGALFSTLFTEKYDQFAAFRTLNSLMVALFFFIDIFISVQTSLVIYFVVIVFGFIMLYSLLRQL